MLLMFNAVFTWAEVPMRWIEAGVQALSDAVSARMPEGPLRSLSDSGEASGKLRRLAVAHEDGGGRVIVAGLGKRDEFDAEKARVAAAVAAGRARELSARSLSWAAPAGEGVAGALVEGTLLALYKFDRFKS